MPEEFLAIGSFTAMATPNAWKALVPTEMRQTALLYLAEKIDQWYVKPDQSGSCSYSTSPIPKRPRHSLISFLWVKLV
jgi:hypothetical protein